MLLRGGDWRDTFIFVDNLGGRRGTMLAFGGVMDQVRAQPTEQTFVSFEGFDIFNPDTGKWRNQPTTGAIPPSYRSASPKSSPPGSGNRDSGKSSESSDHNLSPGIIAAIVIGTILVLLVFCCLIARQLGWPIPFTCLNVQNIAVFKGRIWGLKKTRTRECGHGSEDER